MRNLVRTGALGLLLVPGLAASAANGQVSLGVNRLLVVSAGGAAADNCQGLRDTLTAITDATAANPYVLRLEPGEYDCGTSTVTMKPHVDLEGSGEGITRVFGSHDATADDLGVIDLVDQVEIRFVTIENTGGHFGLATAVSATTAGESRITNATVISDDTTATSCAMFVSLLGGGDPGSVEVHLRDSTIRGDFDGLFLQNGTGKVVARGSTIAGTTDVGISTVMNDEVVLAHSQLINGFFAGGDLTCLFSYDGNLAQLDSGCSSP